MDDKKELTQEEFTELVGSCNMADLIEVKEGKEGKISLMEMLRQKDIERIKKATNKTITIPLAEYNKLTTELEFYKQNVVVVNEGDGPEVGDIVYSECWSEHVHGGGVSQVYELTHFNELNDPGKGWKNASIRRAGKPVITRKKGV